jgi:hypothetical protein
MLYKPVSKDLIANEIKNYLKDNLKIEVEYNSPIGLSDGKIKVTLKLEGEIIDSNEQKIFKTFF